MAMDVTITKSAGQETVPDIIVRNNIVIWRQFSTNNTVIIIWFPPEKLLTLLVGILGQSKSDSPCFCVYKMFKNLEVHEQAL